MLKSCTGNRARGARTVPCSLLSRTWNEGERFPSNFEPLKTLWKGTAKDITKVAVDGDDPYFASLLGACIISHVGGISRKHLVETEETPKVVTSMGWYFVYYSMKRVTKDSRKMAPYITDEMKELVKASLQTKTLWNRKFVRTREEIGLWHKEQSGRKFKNYRYVFSKNGTGVLGIAYEEADLITNKSDDDWTVFVKKDSDGLTKTGQKLFQLAVESYVYAMLGAQAQTRWPIVGRGAKSLQTQDIFSQTGKRHQDDPAKSVADMRTAIKNTNVVLNTHRTLVPSVLTILKEKVAGYNNVLTLATKNMKFGKNKDVNYVEPKAQGGHLEETVGTPKTQGDHLEGKPPKTQEGSIWTPGDITLFRRNAVPSRQCGRLGFSSGKVRDLKDKIFVTLRGYKIFVSR